MLKSERRKAIEDECQSELQSLSRDTDNSVDQDALVLYLTVKAAFLTRGCDKKGKNDPYVVVKFNDKTSLKEK